MHSGEPALSVRDVTKRFGEVVANASVSLDAYAGEVHCLLGENGAGKSTLIAMLAGLQQPDEGSFEVEGAPCELRSPAVAHERGIGVVYQHSTLIPTMSVIDNLMLTQHRGFWLDLATARTHLEELSALLGAVIDPDQRVSELGLGQQQQLEIAAVMQAGPRVLVLDEPTSMLSARGITELTDSIRRLTASGVAVIFVTHKLDEALALGDRITVLREGKVVHRFERDELRQEGEDQATALILAAMFGETVSVQGGSDRELREVRRQARSEDREALSLEFVSTLAAHEGTPIKDVSLKIHAGEIVGVAGIDGHGQRHLAEVIAGQRMPDSGTITLDGQDLTRLSIRKRQRLGVRYVTDDRLREGIVGSFSVALNLLLKRIGERPFWRFGRMNREAVDAHARKLIEQYGVRASSPAAAAGTLSGGNIQKILLARELAGEPRVVVFHKPSYGLDLKTVHLVRDKIRRLAQDGAAVLLISTDLDELIELGDRIEVMSHGEIVGRVENNSGHVREQVGSLMVGGVRR